MSKSRREGDVGIVAIALLVAAGAVAWSVFRDVRDWRRENTPTMICLQCGSRVWIDEVEATENDIQMLLVCKRGHNAVSSLRETYE